MTDVAYRKRCLLERGLIFKLADVASLLSIDTFLHTW